jgi:drug/metabolite transporter (DMT)-like permease
MLQRIQTLYLAIATALSGFLLKGPIVRMVGDDLKTYELNFKGVYYVDNGVVSDIIEKSLPLTIILITVTVLFFLAIFLYKRRKLQIRVTVFSTLLMIGAFLLMLFYIFYSDRKLEAELIFNIKLTFPIISAIFGYLAFRNILKDELLIKSYDRIR